MKSLNLFLLLIAIVAFQWLPAQNMITSDNNYALRLPEGEVNFTVDRSRLMFAFTSDLDMGARNRLKADLVGKHKIIGNYESLSGYSDMAVIKLNSVLDSSAYFDLLNILQQSPGVKYAAPVLLYRNTVQQIPHDLFFVALKSGEDLATLNKYATDLNFSVGQQVSGNIFYCYITKKSGGNAFQLSKYLQNQNIFKFVEPDFIITASAHTNDSLYYQQWSLNNPGPTYWNQAVAGDDIHIQSAWQIKSGAPNITVAILDAFGDTLNAFTHPDFNFTARYDVTGSNFANPFPANGHNAHGLACGGLIAATQNNVIGMAGIADSCKVIAIKVAQPLDDSSNKWATNYTNIYNGIELALQKADIINNSYSLGSSSSLIDGAIHDAVTLGRNGKGCLVFASTGDTDEAVIGYPASNQYAIAVGGTTRCDKKKSMAIGLSGAQVPDCSYDSSWGANYGPGIDIAAPCEAIMTLDIVGPLGFDSSNYCRFHGTSASSPIAAGVMALILTVDSSLTYECARYILESTCDKVGGYSYGINPEQPNGTWCQELGYGRINADSALSLAERYKCYPVGIPVVSNDIGYKIYPNPTGSSVHIETDPGNYPLTLKVYDMIGRVVIPERQINSQSETIELPFTESGIYLLNILNSSGLTLTLRLVKQ